MGRCRIDAGVYDSEREGADGGVESAGPSAEGLGDPASEDFS